MNISTSRFLTLLFAAFLLGLQLCQINHLDPVYKGADTFYAVEYERIVWPSTGISSLSHPKLQAKIQQQEVSHKAQLSQLRQHLERIEQKVKQPFLHRMQQSIDARRVERQQVMSFVVQQQLQLFIQFTPSVTYRHLKPEPDEYTSHFSLS